MANWTCVQLKYFNLRRSLQNYKTNVSKRLKRRTNGSEEDDKDSEVSVTLDTNAVYLDLDRENAVYSNTDLQCAFETHPNPKIVKGILLHIQPCVSEIPVSIVRFENLTVLVMSSCAIKDIPWSFGLLSKLEVMDLSKNDLKVIPYVFIYMPSLVNLNLSQNRIAYVPDYVIKMIDNGLETLTLENNRWLRSPPQDLCNKSVKYLKEALVSRENIKLNRQNLWENDTPWIQSDTPAYISGSIKSLYNTCLDVIFRHNLDAFMNIVDSVPPVMKMRLSEEKQYHEQKLELGKCNKCLRYFSNAENFRIHDCRDPLKMKPVSQQRN